MNNTRKIQIKVIICAVLCILTLTACTRSNRENNSVDSNMDHSTYQPQNTTESTSQNEEKEVRVIPAEVSAEYDLLSVQAKVVVPDGVNLDRVSLGTATVHLLDLDKISEELSNGEAAKEEMEEEDENGNEDLDSYFSRYLYFEDGRSLILNPVHLSYYTPQAACIDGKVLWEEKGVDRYNIDIYKDKELPFAESAEVYKEVQSRLEQWGIVLGEKYELFGLDHKTMEEQEYVTDDKGKYAPSLKKGSWTEEDDCYYFRCAQEFCGIPIYYYGYGMLRGYRNIGSAFKIKYDKNGFVEIAIERPYDVQDTGRTARILSPEDAVDCLIQKFSNIIMMDPVTVDKVSLQMLPQRTAPGCYDLIPVWIFEGSEHWVLDDGSEVDVSDKYMFDAVTGKEIIL